MNYRDFNFNFNKQLDLQADLKLRNETTSIFDSTVRAAILDFRLLVIDNYWFFGNAGPPKKRTLLQSLEYFVISTSSCDSSSSSVVRSNYIVCLDSGSKRVTGWDDGTFKRLDLHPRTSRRYINYFTYLLCLHNADRIRPRRPAVFRTDAHILTSGRFFNRITHVLLIKFIR